MNNLNTDSDLLLLLNTNYNNIKFNNIDVNSELEIYNKSLLNENNYVPSACHFTLESWYDTKHVYPNIDPRHRFIVDEIKSHNYKKIIDLGAGSGCVSKYVYAENPKIEELVCVEHSSTHFAQMIDNFQNKTDIIPPDIKVDAETINNDIYNTLKTYSDNYFDVGFTCTVLMHIPYIHSIYIIKELSRVCKNIIHAENQNDMVNCVVNGLTKLKEEYCLINYKNIYELLNFNIIKHDRVKDPYANCYYIYVHVSKNI